MKRRGYRPCPSPSDQTSWFDTSARFDTRPPGLTRQLRCWEQKLTTTLKARQPQQAVCRDVVHTLRLQLRLPGELRPFPRPYKVAPPTACRKGVCSRVQARTSPFFAQRIKLSFASNRNIKEKVKQKVFVDGFNKRDKVTQLLYLLTS